MKKEYNIGLAILRTIMCFMVVLCHCWDTSNVQGILKIFLWTRDFAVPVFMMMSFILVQKWLVSHNKQQMIGRFERLLIPQFGWAIIYWVVYFSIGVLIQNQSELRVTDMIWQMFFGHSLRLNPSMWYQVDLIYLTLLFLVVIFLFRKNYEIVLWMLAIIALIVQYSDANMIFNDWRNELKYPIGRFAEMLPVAVVGFLISSKNVLEIIKRNKLAVIMTLISIICLDAKYGFFSTVSGYGYSGVRMLVIAAAFLALFYIIPFEMLNEKIKRIIGFLSSYTLGIYCMHRLIATLLNGVITHWNIGIVLNSFSECILIYIICFICAWIGDKIVGKTKLKMLFN